MEVATRIEQTARLVGGETAHRAVEAVTQRAPRRRVQVEGSDEARLLELAISRLEIDISRLEIDISRLEIAPRSPLEIAPLPGRPAPFLAAARRRAARPAALPPRRAARRAARRCAVAWLQVEAAADEECAAKHRHGMHHAAAQLVRRAAHVATPRHARCAQRRA